MLRAMGAVVESSTVDTKGERVHRRWYITRLVAALVGAFGFGVGWSRSGSAPVQSQKRKTTMSEKGRILGIGGIFFKSANQKEMKEWYGKHLGLTDSGHGVMLPWREKDNP